MFILDGCGDLPGGLLSLISWCFKIIRIGVPIALVIWGMLDFAKATFSSKEDEMDKAKTHLVFRLVAGAAVFLVMALTQWVMEIVSVNDANSMVACVAGLMEGYEGGKGDLDKPNKTTTTLSNTSCDEYTGNDLTLCKDCQSHLDYQGSVDLCVSRGGYDKYLAYNDCENKEVALSNIIKKCATASEHSSNISILVTPAFALLKSGQALSYLIDGESMYYNTCKVVIEDGFNLASYNIATALANFIGDYQDEWKAKEAEIDACLADASK